ncbi:uncharacterized protein LOC127868529 [Dreissena polymorpha]|uniref:uncharacterized protein LOC127868529 n=1 Tax=Dreissena polymorpha TaxID=45954 RepID=UPI002263EF8F|nr:uncharacterized protein LOC127868529 [Dreissena polymorpha]
MIGLMFLFAVVSQVYAKFDPIAFTVYQASGNFPGNATITYPHNITIHSSATNVLNGIFTSTRDGIYKFSVFGCSRTDGHFILDLIKNTTSLATLYGHVNSGHAVAANSVIVHLKVGDTVKVKSKDASPVSLYSSDFKENTFTGVQLGSQSLYSREHAAVIAFSVTANHHQNVIGDAIVQYHTKLVDDAGDLDLTSGIYMARSSGYYVLYFSSTSMQNEELWLDLWATKDHVERYICSIYAHVDFEWASAGNTVIVHLSSGEQVAVFSRPGHVSRLFGSYDYQFTSFGGSQIISDEELRNPDAEPVVVFSVGLSKNATVLIGQNVIFNKIFVDLKKAYNNNTGVFVVPVTGIYEFHYHCLSRANSAMTLALYRGNSVVNGFLNILNAVHAFSAGNAAVLELKGGETISLRAYVHHNLNLIGASDEVYCTFSGYMLHSTGPIVIG